jgi:HK97 family phage major capsid protein
MAARIKKLQDRAAALTAAMRALNDKAAKEERQFSDPEQTEYDAHKGELAEVQVDLKREQELQELEKNLVPVDDGNAPTPGEAAAQAGRREPAAKSEWADDPNRGFKSKNDFLTAVLNHGEQAASNARDPRLRALARMKPLETAGSDEAGAYSDPYGGFLLPRGFSPDLLSLDPEEDPIAALTTKIPMDTAVFDIPARVDKNHSTSVSGGLRVYRRAETDTSTATRMEFEQVTMRAHALFGVSYATEELLSRSPRSFIALLEAGFKDEFTATGLEEKLTGSGVGMPEGIANTPCLIDVDKESGQAADTVVYQNVVKMAARCWRFGRAVWTANHNVLPQLAQMTMDVGTGGVPVWQFSAREGFPSMLLGRPIYFTEFAETLGDVGDIALCVWDQYLEGTLTAPQSAESIHVRFINHERCFKFWMENDGRWWWRSALTPRNGDTLSPVVRLAERA